MAKVSMSSVEVTSHGVYLHYEGGLEQLPIVLQRVGKVIRGQGLTDAEVEDLRERGATVRVRKARVKR